jgi:probable HAF family extracellular repeat protein
MKQKPYAVQSLFVCVILAATAAAEPTFNGIGFLPGLSSSRAYGVSADGRYVVGDSTTAGNVNYAGFRWSQQGGMESLGVASGGSISQAVAASADGSVIAARSPAPFPPGSFGTAAAARWTPSTGMVSLGNYFTSSTYQTQGATGISSNGSAVVGNALFFGNNQSYGFRWTADGFRTLGSLAGGTYASATGISGTGLRAVGFSGSASGERAVRWDVTPGTGGITPISLGILSGGTYSTATAISHDGLSVVGFGNTGGVTVPWRWTESGGMVNLGLPIGATEARARGVNIDGSVVVGNTNSLAQSRAFLWTTTTGSVDLNTYLPTLGIDLTGWSLRTATGVSADGRVIVGSGIFGGVEQAWVATIPTPAGTSLLVFAGVVATRRRR